MTVLEAIVGAFTGIDPAEQHRRATRDRTLERIAHVRLDEELARDLEGRIASLDERDEELVAAHQAACRPLQGEIANLEKQAMASLSRREPIPQNIQERMADLRRQVDQHNVTLETGISTNKKLRDTLQTDLRKARLKAIEIDALQRMLTRELASPELLRQQFVEQQNHEWTHKRLQHARAKSAEREAVAAMLNRKPDGDSESLSYRRNHDEYERQKSNAQQAATFDLQASYWRAEVAECERLIEESRLRAQSIRQQMIDE